MFLFQPRASIQQDTSLWKQLAFCHFCYYKDSSGPPDSWGYVKKSYYQDPWILSCPGNLQSHVNQYYTVFHFNICTQAKGVLRACFRADFLCVFCFVFYICLQIHFLLRCFIKLVNFNKIKSFPNARGKICCYQCLSPQFRLKCCFSVLCSKSDHISSWNGYLPLFLLQSDLHSFVQLYLGDHAKLNVVL